MRFSGSWVRVGAKSLLVFVLVGVTRSGYCGRVPPIYRVVAKTGTLTPGRCGRGSVPPACRSQAQVSDRRIDRNQASDHPGWMCLSGDPLFRFLCRNQRRRRFRAAYRSRRPAWGAGNRDHQPGGAHADHDHVRRVRAASRARTNPVRAGPHLAGLPRLRDASPGTPRGDHTRSRTTRRSVVEPGQGQLRGRLGRHDRSRHLDGIALLSLPLALREATREFAR